MLFSKRMVGTIVALALAVVLAACSNFGGTVEPSGEPVDLNETEWLLASLKGSSLVEGFTIVISFHNGRDVGGNAGCNYYGATYIISGSDFSISDRRIDKTNFDCDVPESVMQQEVAYFEALANAASYRTIGNRLEIDDASGETMLVFFLKEPPPIDPALDGTEWVLASLNGSDLIAGSNITLDFAEGGAGGFAGCNGYGGEYAAADEGVLAIPEFAVTAMDCSTPEEIMEQEKTYVEALRNATAYRVVDDRLEIDSASGETTLVFTRKEEYAMDPSDLVGTGWQLVSWEGNSLIEGSSITLAFHDEGRGGGSAGCRGYVATYEASGDDTGFISLAMLGRFEHCSDELMLQEGEYTTGLEQMSNYRLSERHLELLTVRGETLVFEPLPENADTSLEGTAWTLLGFIEERTVEGMTTPALIPLDLLPETEITMAFEAGAVNGSTGCNTYHAGYALDGLSFIVEPIAVTEMACLDPAGVMEQEQRYLGFLKDVIIYRVYGSQLWLGTGDGRTLVFTAAVGDPHLGTDEAVLDLLSGVLGEPITNHTTSSKSDYPSAVLAAIDKLSESSGLAADQIEVVSFQQVEWGNSCLGVMRPEEMCADVITPGWIIVLRAGERVFEFHTDQLGTSLRQK